MPVGRGARLPLAGPSRAADCGLNEVSDEWVRWVGVEWSGVDGRETGYSLMALARQEQAQSREEDEPEHQAKDVLP